MIHHPVGARPISADATPKTTSPKTNRASSPQDVSCAGSQQEQAAEDQRVGVLHPGKLGRREVEVGADARQSGEDHRVVEQDHEVAGQDDREDRPGRAFTESVAVAGVTDAPSP